MAKTTDIPIATIQSKREALVAIRDQLRLQLNGIENQIYILDQLLNPEPVSTPASESMPEPAELPPGTI